MDWTTKPATARPRHKTCHNTLWRDRECGETLRTIATSRGYTTLCLRCAYRKAGKCWQCGQPREDTGPQHIFCNDCARRRILDSNARSLNDPAHLERLERVKAYRRNRWERIKAERGKP